MDITPMALLTIQRDWKQLSLRQISLNLLPANAVRALLDRLISFKTRLVRCRNVRSRRAKQLRATLMRATFSGWRATLKNLIRDSTHRDAAVAHLRHCLQTESVFDPHNWAVKMITLDSLVLRNFIPEINTTIPVTAQNDDRDSYWQSLKTTLSTGRL